MVLQWQQQLPQLWLFHHHHHHYYYSTPSSSSLLLFRFVSKPIGTRRLQRPERRFRSSTIHHQRNTLCCLIHSTKSTCSTFDVKATSTTKFQRMSTTINLVVGIDKCDSPNKYKNIHQRPVDVAELVQPPPQQQYQSEHSQQQQQLTRMTAQFLQDDVDRTHSNNGCHNSHIHQLSIAMIQNLLERWIQYYYSSRCKVTATNAPKHQHHSSKEIALRFITILYQKWFHCYCDMQREQPQDSNSTIHSSSSNNASREMMHYLYRILYMLQQESKQHYHNRKFQYKHGQDSNVKTNNKYIQKSYQLLQKFYNYSRNGHDPRFHPKPKAYSMVLEALSYCNIDHDNVDDDQNIMSTANSNTNDNNNNKNDETWNTAIIVDMADDLMEQLHELYKNHILERKSNHRPYGKENDHYNVVPEDILVAQNSYLRLLARFCDRRRRRSHTSIGSTPNLAEKAEEYLWNVMTHQSLPLAPPNMQSYSAVLQGYVNQNAPEQACAVLHRMIDHGIMPDQICYNVCLQALGNAGHATAAHDLLLQMIQLSKDGSVNTNSDIPLLQPPDVYSYFAVIKAYANCCDVTHVIHVFEQMIQNNILPNSVIYTTVLDVLAHQPNSGPLVDQMLQYLERLHYGDENTICRRPNVPTASTSYTTFVKPCREAYTIAVRAWGKTTNDVSAPDHATNVFRRMHNLSLLQEQEEGSSDASASSHGGVNSLSPCTISYTALIHAWAQSSRKDAPDRALQILRFMERRQQIGAIPDSITYNVVLSALARHGLATEAHQLLNEMIMRMMHNMNESRKRIVYPNVISWATVIEAYTRTQRSDSGNKANALLLELEHIYDTTGLISLQPTADIYSVAILAQKWEDCSDIAEEIFWRMIDRYQRNSIAQNNPPNTSVCNALLRLWSNSSDPVAPQRAEMILRWMEDHQAGTTSQRDTGHKPLLFLAPNHESYQYVLKTWYRSKRRNANIHIQTILRKMHKHKST